MELGPGDLFWFTTVSSDAVGADSDTRIHFKLELPSNGPINQETSEYGKYTIELNYDFADADNAFSIYADKYFNVSNDIPSALTTVIFSQGKILAGGKYHNYFKLFDNLVKGFGEAHGMLNKSVAGCIASAVEGINEMIEGLTSDYQIVVLIALTTDKDCFNDEGRNTCTPYCP